MSCEQVRMHDTLMSEKDEEIERLKKQLDDGVERSTVSSLVAPSEADVELPPITPARATRRGKAPPVDSYTGENPEITLDDWLPSLKRAATYGVVVSSSCNWQDICAAVRCRSGIS